MIKQILLAHSFNVSQELCFTRGSTASHTAGISIHPAGTKALAQKQGLVFALRALEKVVGFADVILRDGVTRNRQTAG